MADPVIYGNPLSTCTRTARMARATVPPLDKL